ncbi:MAG: hypothetical protein ACTHJ5_13325 [Ilyomonas sp.]
MKNLFLRFLVIVIVFTSCKKENSNPSSMDIKGTWKFIEMEVKATSIKEFSDESGKQKTISINDFTTVNNSGTVVFDGSKASLNDLTYTINTVTKAEVYMNDQLVQTVEMPLTAPVPATSSSSDYKLIGSDSIHFDNGTMFFNNMSQEVDASGAKLSLQGNILYMTSTINDIRTEVIQGINILSTTNAITRVKLHRQ